MKAFLFSTLIAFSAVAAHADDSAQLATQAAGEYAQRDFSNNGINHAQAAADLYAKAVAATADTTMKAKYLIAQSESLFFVGNASTARDTKIARHLQGKEIGDQGLKLLGVEANMNDAAAKAAYAKLTADQKALVGEGLYQRGINLGQWGAANGVVDSLSKWPELRRSMEIIQVLGLEAIHDYGAARVLGRGYFKIPSLLGGDMKKATALLKMAVEKTVVPGQIHSWNGFNNIYYAEILKENGADDQAVALLESYIKDPATDVHFKDIMAETKQYQKEAQELLASW